MLGGSTCERVPRGGCKAANTKQTSICRLSLKLQCECSIYKAIKHSPCPGGCKAANKGTSLKSRCPQMCPVSRLATKQCGTSVTKHALIALMVMGRTVHTARQSGNTLQCSCASGKREAPSWNTARQQRYASAKGNTLLPSVRQSKQCNRVPPNPCTTEHGATATESTSTTFTLLTGLVC